MGMGDSTSGPLAPPPITSARALLSRCRLGRHTARRTCSSVRLSVWLTSDSVAVNAACSLATRSLLSTRSLLTSASSLSLRSLPSPVAGLYILSNWLIRSRTSSATVSASGNAVGFDVVCIANILFIICNSSSLIRSFSLRPSLSLSLRFSFSHSLLSPVVVVRPSSTSGGFHSFEIANAEQRVFFIVLATPGFILK